MTETAEAAEAKTRSAEAEEYRAPARFSVGEAVDVIRRSYLNGFRDGTGGWYVWGI